MVGKERYFQLEMVFVKTIHLVGSETSCPGWLYNWAKIHRHFCIILKSGHHWYQWFFKHLTITTESFCIVWPLISIEKLARLKIILHIVPNGKTCLPSRPCGNLLHKPFETDQLLKHTERTSEISKLGNVVGCRSLGCWLDRGEILPRAQSSCVSSELCFYPT